MEHVDTALLVTNVAKILPPRRPTPRRLARAKQPQARVLRPQRRSHQALGLLLQPLRVEVRLRHLRCRIRLWLRGREQGPRQGPRHERLRPVGGHSHHPVSKPHWATLTLSKRVCNFERVAALGHSSEPTPVDDESQTLQSIACLLVFTASLLGLGAIHAGAPDMTHVSQVNAAGQATFNWNPYVPVGNEIWENNRFCPRPRHEPAERKPARDSRRQLVGHPGLSVRRHPNGLVRQRQTVHG